MYLVNIYLIGFLSVRFGMVFMFVFYIFIRVRKIKQTQIIREIKHILENFRNSFVYSVTNITGTVGNNFDK